MYAVSLRSFRKSPPHFNIVQFRLLGPRGHKPRKNQRQRAAFAPFSSYACRARTVASTFLCMLYYIENEFKGQVQMDVDRGKSQRAFERCEGTVYT
jgi:hypothetical protein